MSTKEDGVKMAAFEARLAEFDEACLMETKRREYFEVWDTFAASVLAGLSDWSETPAGIAAAAAAIATAMMVERDKALAKIT